MIKEITSEIAEGDRSTIKRVGHLLRYPKVLTDPVSIEQDVVNIDGSLRIAIA